MPTVYFDFFILALKRQYTVRDLIIIICSVVGVTRDRVVTRTQPRFMLTVKQNLHKVSSIHNTKSTQEVFDSKMLL